MASSDNVKQPDTVPLVLKVYAILQAPGKIAITV